MNSILNGVLLSYKVIGLEEILKTSYYGKFFEDLMIYSDFQLQQIKIKLHSKIGISAIVSVLEAEEIDIMLNFLLAQDFECCIDGVRGRLFTLENILRINDIGLQSYSLEVLINDIVVSGLFATEFLKTMIGLDYKESAAYFSYLQKLLLVKFNQEEKLELDYYLSQDVKKIVDQDIEESLDVFIEQQFPAILFRQAHSHLAKLCHNEISKENYLQLEYILSAFDLENKDIQRYYSNPELLNLELSDLVFNDLVKKNYIRNVKLSNSMYQVSSVPQPPKSFFQLLGFSDLFEGVFPQ